MLEAKPKSLTKQRLCKVGLYLTPFVYAAFLVEWGNSLPAWGVILSGCVVIGIFVLAGLLHLKEIGGWKRVEEYIQSHLWSSIAAIVALCCVIMGTWIYLAVRPHPKTTLIASGNTIPPKPTPQPNVPPITQIPNLVVPANRQPSYHAPAIAQPIPQPKVVPMPPPSPPAEVLSAPTPVPQSIPTQQQPTYQQQCTGSNCFQGTNNGTVQQNINTARALSETEATVLRNAISKYPPQTISITSYLSSDDAHNFGIEIGNQILRGGWAVRGNAVNMAVATQFDSVRGLVILVKDKSSPPPKALQLQSALAEANFPVPILDGDSNDGEAVLLWIGAR
jgi:hypothetical protein